MCQLNHDALCVEEMTTAEIEGFWRGYGRYDRSELRSAFVKDTHSPPLGKGIGVR